MKEKVSEEKERILKLLSEKEDGEQGVDQGVDYAEEYRKQTGKDLTTGEYVTQ